MFKEKCDMIPQHEYATYGLHSPAHTDQLTLRQQNLNIQQLIIPKNGTEHNTEPVQSSSHPFPSLTSMQRVCLYHNPSLMKIHKF